LLVYLWGIWHGLAQTYGFLRIYDAKVQSSARLTCRLDLAMCVAWFVGGVALSPTRGRVVLEMLYKSGLPVVPAEWVGAIRSAAIVLLALVNLAFVANLVARWREGQAPSFLKLSLMVTSFGFWWLCNVAIHELLLGVLMFEVFHDVQYLSIVWAFNRKRVESAAGLTDFTRFLFRRRGVLLGVYVGLVFAYGALNYVPRGMDSELPRRVLLGVLAASALLHFYYDGFIWKVRESSTRQSLGLSGGRDERARARAMTIPTWMEHGAKWAGLFLLPLVGLGVAQARGLAPTVERSRSLLTISGSADDELHLGLDLLSAGRADEALQHFRSVLAAVPGRGEARVGLADALYARGELDAAASEYRGLVDQPGDAPAQSVASAHNGLGNVLVRQARVPEALGEYRRALELDPGLVTAQGNLANALAAGGNAREAIEILRRAIDARPGDPDVPPLQRDLARTLLAEGRPAEALTGLEAALASAPGDPDLTLALADARIQAGDPAAAAKAYRELLRLQPGSVEAHFGLANALALLGQAEEAVAHYRQALELDPTLAEAHHNLGRVLFGIGRVAEAETSLRAAVQLDPQYRDAHLGLAALLRARGVNDEAAEHEALAARLH